MSPVVSTEAAGGGGPSCRAPYRQNHISSNVDHMYPLLIQDTDIGHVRHQLEVLARLRLTTGLAAQEQARYESLCARERRLLSGTPPGAAKVMGRSLLAVP